MSDYIVHRRKNRADKVIGELVRCKECRYWNTSGCRDGVGECEWAYYMTKPNDFCSYGVRKTNTTAEEKPTPIRDYMVHGEREGK